MDISNHQAGLDQGNFQAWALQGCKAIITGTDGGGQYPPIDFPRQIGLARNAGITAEECYIYLYFGENGEQWDSAKRTNLKLDLIDQVGGIKRVWLDCEQEKHGLDDVTLFNHIVAARDIVQRRGYECGIYTGAWWWKPYMKDTNEFSYLPLWAAQYDGGVQSLDLVGGGFGGWTTCVRKQYTDRGVLGGYSPLDLNLEYAPIIAAQNLVEAEPQGTSPTLPDSLTLVRFHLEEALRALTQSGH